MRLNQFYYQLPDELIANYPLAERSASRLLALDGKTGSVQHSKFDRIIDLLEEGDLLVMNDTRVIPARLLGNKSSGGRIEILVERVLNKQTILAHVRASKTPRLDAELIVKGDSGNQFKARVTGREDNLFVLEFSGIAEQRGVMSVLEQVGHVPLPPYIDRPDTDSDRERYQTVYARSPGAVAAPTAGLHFDKTLLERLEKKGVKRAFVTLHVGAGTFQPVRTEKIIEHRMHSEVIHVDEEACRQVNTTRDAGKRVIAVGTTSVRCLETAGRSGRLEPMQGETDIFIYPGYRFNMVDALITNFHLPESTLLMLVSAFAGYRNTMTAYREAVENRYRFFSYGDAMFITQNPNALDEKMP